MNHGDARFHLHTSKPKFAGATLLTAAVLAVTMLALAGPASAAAYENSVNLGTAAPYSVLAGTTVTSTGPTVLSGSLGVSPGSAITQVDPIVVGGATNAGNAAAASAQGGLTAGYLAAEGRAPTGTSINAGLAGGTLLPGVYKANSALSVTGNVTLNGQGDPNSVFIFQVGSSLTTGNGTSIVLIGKAQACNVFWQVGASATLGTTNAFVGTVMALTSITVNTGTTVRGRALARNGAVTLDDNVFTSAACVTTTTHTTLTTTPTTTGGTSTLTATVSAPGAATPTGSVTFTANGVVIGTATVGANGKATLMVPGGPTAQVRNVTARFNGHISFGPSTSTPVGLITVAIPGAGIPNSGVPGNGITLASTGPGPVVGLTSAAGALLLSGVALVIGARRRRPGRHVAAAH